MRHKLILPDLGLPHVTVSVWLVDRGAKIAAGERIVEVLSDGVTVDLPAPVSGVLIKQLVSEDDPIVIGQVLAWIEDEPKAE
ncbi:MAG: lipoyl domain-containing protein [Planctomycetaceae bacterium]|nr:lipoyl domain-containing protein [Planctomycetaceae bacterium]